MEEEDFDTISKQVKVAGTIPQMVWVLGFSCRLDCGVQGDGYNIGWSIPITYGQLVVLLVE